MSAGLQDPDPGKYEVEPDGILGAHRPERIGNLLRHPPVGAIAGGEPQPLAQSRHVRVDGDNQLPRGKNRPEPQIHPVCLPHHPAQEQVVPLAGRSLSRVGEQKIPFPGDRGPPRLPETGEKAAQPYARPAVSPLPGPPVEGFQRAVREKNRPNAIKKTVDSGRGDEPVGKIRDTGPGDGAAPRQGRMGRRAKDPEHPLEKRQDPGHIAEGEGGRHERRDLGVRAVREPVGKPDGVGRQVGCPVRKKR